MNDLKKLVETAAANAQSCPGHDENCEFLGHSGCSANNFSESNHETCNGKNHFWCEICQVHFTIDEKYNIEYLDNQK